MCRGWLNCPVNWAPQLCLHVVLLTSMLHIVESLPNSHSCLSSLGPILFEFYFSTFGCIFHSLRLHRLWDLSNGKTSFKFQIAGWLYEKDVTSRRIHIPLLEKPQPSLAEYIVSSTLWVNYAPAPNSLSWTPNSQYDDIWGWRLWDIVGIRE